MCGRNFFLQGDRSEDRDSENYGKSDGDRTNTTNRSFDDDSSSSDEDDNGMNPNRAQPVNKSGFTDDPENRSGLNVDSPANLRTVEIVLEKIQLVAALKMPQKKPQQKVQTLCLI